MVYPLERGSVLKTRVTALILLIVSASFGILNGIHLEQALSAEHELRSQMGDLSLATMSDATASSSAVSLGESSLKEALNEVRSTSHREEAMVAVEALGLLVGTVLLRRSRKPILH